MTRFTTIPLGWRLGAAVTVAGVALAGCSGGSSTTSSSTPTSASTTAAGTTGGTNGASAQVLPVSKNPITNTSSVQALKIDAVLVENNVDASGKAAADHLEIVLQNTGSTPLGGFEIYYTFTDLTAKSTESYYAKLPDTFTIPAGGKRIAHFDTTGAADHFPVNKFNLYYTSKNALEVSVTVSAQGAAVQTTTLKKDAGGAEASD